MIRARLESQIEKLSAILEKEAKPRGGWVRAGFDAFVEDAKRKAKGTGPEVSFGVNQLRNLRRGLLHMLALENNAPALLPPAKAVEVRLLMDEDKDDQAADYVIGSHFAEKHPDGPGPHNCYWFHGDFAKLQPLDWLLVKTLVENGEMDIDDACAAVWGTDASDAAIGAAKTRANKALQSIPAPYRVVTKSGRIFLKTI